MGVSTLAAAVTASFYAWEIRGRGWSLADYPVSLEPPHRPFFLLPGLGYDQAPVDDGKRPTLLSTLAEGAARLFHRQEASASATEPFEEETAYPGASQIPLATLEIRAQPDFQAKLEEQLRLIAALSVASRPVSFELIGHAGAVTLQVVCAEEDLAHVEESIVGYVPEVTVLRGTDRLQESWEFGAPQLIVDFGLAQEFFLPLTVPRALDPDPYIPIAHALARTGRGETVCLQILFEHVRNPWGRTIHAALVGPDGTDLIADAPDFPSLAREKTKTPFLAVVVRLATLARTDERARELAWSCVGFFQQFTRADGNEFIPLDNDGYSVPLHEEALVERTSYRTGMLLSAAELANLVHIPDASLRHAALKREHIATSAAPSEAKGHTIILGTNEHRGVVEQVTISEEARLEHMHVIGASGTGKSTFLLNLICQDIYLGHGIGVLDPHGDLVDEILARIPKERNGDVIVFDPSDEEWPVGFNVLAAGSDIEKNLLAADLVGIVERLSTSWGDTMTTVLGNAVAAFLEHPEGGTLLDLRRFLIDERFRSAFLTGVNDDAIRFFWEHEYALIGTRSVGPILTRLDTFLRSRTIRNIVSQKNARLNFAATLAEGKIFLAKLSQGLIGEANAALLGSLLVTKFHQLALARQQSPKSARRPFYLYLDEFQHFVTPSMASLLTEGRKYGIGLVLAHQSLAQLDLSPRVESAMLSAYARVAFRTSDSDARKLADGFASFDASTLQRLRRGQALVRFGSAASDCNLSTALPEAVDENTADRRRTDVIAHSRQRYATPRAEIQVATTIALPEQSIEVVARPREKPAPVQPEPAPIQLEVPPVEHPMTSHEVQRTPAPRKTTPAAPTPQRAGNTTELGRGGQQHKYIQHLIKRLAEERGLRAIIEEATIDGRSVDVVLRSDTTAIACEVSVTTDVEHELQNIRKCVDLGFSRILFVSPDKRRREKLAAGVQGIGSIPIDAIAPEEIVAVLDDLQTGASPAESTVRGYKVKVKRQTLAYADVAQRRSVLAQVIARSLAQR
ncbi:MAG: type IV secretion system DNA-binding domain-containing protein [Candidatus Binataceae bacterium]|nr:type IV secretion system DNA-binding domain-containing protein [Candidatus Binataceae bacterium]